MYRYYILAGPLLSFAHRSYPPMTPRFGCLYAPGLPAWTHHFLHDFLRDGARHLAVTGRGRIVGASRAARRAGVTTGMPTERAKVLLPEGATIVPREPEQEAAAWEAVCAQVNLLTPRLESPRPGLLYLEPREEADLQHLAADLHLQGAVAPDRQTALLGATRSTSGHVLVIRPCDRNAFLARYPVRLLTRLGFTEETTGRLQLFGFEQLRPLRRLTRRHLTAQFGEEGARLYALLHPGREQRVAFHQPPPQVSATYDVEEWLGDMQPVRLALEETMRRAAAELEGRRTQRLTLQLELRGGQILRRLRMLREPTGDLRRLHRFATRLLEETASDTAFAEAGGLAALTTLRLELGTLRRAEVRQGALFAERPGVEAAIRAVQRRFPGALLGCRLRTHALFPEDRTELVPLEVSQDA